MVLFKSSAPIASDTVLDVLSGKTNISGLQIDESVTSITEVTADEDNVAWYNDPIYISVICVGAAVVVTIIIVLVICCATKSRRKPTSGRNLWDSDYAQRRVQQNMLIPRAKVSRDTARQMYHNPVYSVSE
ncbi:uncharacterized protein LOC118425747 [Branchiostoma floridae]|uniref:Uncharacterized protein LOC118425747 n=1 Tax=Branchiostoma floridae TaxID=7739 RepID=A0A9J7N5H9_BRAFL|nr:uncharacterized protein LOC118425747 [Branchiostoma floridae]